MMPVGVGSPTIKRTKQGDQIEVMVTEGHCGDPNDRRSLLGLGSSRCKGPEWEQIQRSIHKKAEGWSRPDKGEVVRNEMEG